MMKVVAPKLLAKVQASCGIVGGNIWNFLQNQESNQRYGQKGIILHDADSIQRGTGYDLATVQRSTLKLVQNGFARMTHDGNRVRAV